jgi:hypothetical protein
MYVGKSDTDLMFSGRSGKVYIFSAKRRFAWIDPTDVSRLSSKSVLRMIDPSQLHRASPQLELPAAGKAPREVDHESVHV